MSKIYRNKEIHQLKFWSDYTDTMSWLKPVNDKDFEKGEEGYYEDKLSTYDELDKVWEEGGKW